MRTRHWLAALVGGCMALAGVGKATAQPPMMPSNGNPDQAGLGMLPAPYNTAYGPPQQSYSGMGAAGYPPGATAWPNVSPFAGPPVDSSSYENGFWFNRILQGNRKYYYSAEALLGHTTKGSETLIGAPGVNPQTIDNLQGITNTVNGLTTTTGLLGLTQFVQAPLGTGPTRSIGATGGGGGGGGGTGNLGSQIIFGSVDTGVVGSTLISGGFRGTWGWFNADDSGFVVSGFAQNKASSSFLLNDSALVIDPNDGHFNPLQHLHAWFGLPLAGADTDGDHLFGAVIPYDMGVQIQFTSALLGANSDWYFNSIYERKNLKVRPLAGARYVHLRETFLFDAFDSGLGYTINSTTTNGGGGGGGGGGNGGANGIGTGFLTPLVLQTNFSIPNVIHSHLNSTALSQMGGPEAGVRFDLGGKKFQMWGQTKFGALANVTDRQLSGFGVGNAFNIITDTVNNVNNTVPVLPNDPTKTAFSSRQTTTSFSPMFEQSINVKLPIFNLIPYLNKIEIFERAQLQAGYTFLYIGDVYRPQNAIIWNQTTVDRFADGTTGKTKIAPQLNGQKSDFFNSNFNLGIEWQY